MCERLHAPNAWRDLAMLALKHRERVQAADTLPAKDMLDLLGELDAWRRGERFEDILLVCRADARLPDDATGYPPERALRAARAASAAVRIDDLVAASKDGKAIAHELRERRIHAIQKIRG